MMKPKLEGFVEGWNAIAAPATSATIPEINVNTTEKVPDLMQFQVWYFFFALEDARNGYSSGFFYVRQKPQTAAVRCPAVFS
jgi:hypothetical protein